MLMHGMRLDGQDAADVTTMALTVSLEAMEGASTFLAAEVASGWVAAALRDAHALGACVEQMCALTGLGPDAVRGLLGREASC